MGVRKHNIQVDFVDKLVFTDYIGLQDVLVVYESNRILILDALFKLRMFNLNVPPGSKIVAVKLRQDIVFMMVSVESEYRLYLYKYHSDAIKATKFELSFEDFESFDFDADFQITNNILHPISLFVKVKDKLRLYILKDYVAVQNTFEFKNVWSFVVLGNNMVLVSKVNGEISVCDYEFNEKYSIEDKMNFHTHYKLHSDKSTNLLVFDKEIVVFLTLTEYGYKFKPFKLSSKLKVFAFNPYVNKLYLEDKRMIEIKWYESEYMDLEDVNYLKSFGLYKVNKQKCLKYYKDDYLRIEDVEAKVQMCLAYLKVTGFDKLLMDSIVLFTKFDPLLRANYFESILKLYSELSCLRNINSRMNFDIDYYTFHHAYSTVIMMLCEKNKYNVAFNIQEVIDEVSFDSIDILMHYLKRIITMHSKTNDNILFTYMNTVVQRYEFCFRDSVRKRIDFQLLSDLALKKGLTGLSKRLFELNDPSVIKKLEYKLKNKEFEHAIEYATEQESNDYMKKCVEFVEYQPSLANINNRIRDYYCHWLKWHRPEDLFSFLFDNFTQYKQLISQNRSVSLESKDLKYFKFYFTHLLLYTINHYYHSRNSSFFTKFLSIYQDNFQYVKNESLNLNLFEWYYNNIYEYYVDELEFKGLHSEMELHYGEKNNKNHKGHAHASIFDKIMYLVEQGELPQLQTYIEKVVLNPKAKTTYKVPTNTFELYYLLKEGQQSGSINKLLSKVNSTGFKFLNLSLVVYIIQNLFQLEDEKLWYKLVENTELPNEVRFHIYKSQAMYNLAYNKSVELKDEFYFMQLTNDDKCPRAVKLKCDKFLNY